MNYTGTAFKYFLIITLCMFKLHGYLQYTELIVNIYVPTDKANIQNIILKMPTNLINRDLQGSKRGT